MWWLLVGGPWGPQPGVQDPHPEWGGPDPIPGEGRTWGVRRSCPSSLGAGLPWGLVFGVLCSAGRARRRLSWARIVQHGCSAQVGALHVAGGWHHCPSPARKQCLLTEASIMCELMRHALHVHVHPWEASWDGAGLTGAVWLCGAALCSMLSGARGPITCGAHLWEWRQPRALDRSV